MSALVVVAVAAFVAHIVDIINCDERRDSRPAKRASPSFVLIEFDRQSTLVNCINFHSHCNQYSTQQ